VQEVPGHEGGVAVGEVVVRAAAALVEVGRSGAGLPDPAGVGVGRDRVADVLERVEDVLGAVLDPALRPEKSRSGESVTRATLAPHTDGGVPPDLTN
jgi:hypothetical protein